MLAGVIEIDHLDALGKDRTEVTPVVLRPVGELDQRQVAPLPEHRRQLLAERILQPRAPGLPRSHSPSSAHHAAGGERRPCPDGVAERRKQHPLRNRGVAWAHRTGRRARAGRRSAGAGLSLLCARLSFRRVYLPRTGGLARRVRLRGDCAEGLEAAPTKGRLDFGPWEQIFYREFDGQRRQRVLVKVSVVPTRGL